MGQAIFYDSFTEQRPFYYGARLLYLANFSVWMVLARLNTGGSKNAVFSDYELSGPAKRRKTGGTEYIKGCAGNAEWNQRLAQDRYSNRLGSYDNANMEKESRDAHSCLAKTFSSSPQEITDELLVSLSESMFYALHEPGDSGYPYIEIGVFRTGNRETPGEDHTDLHNNL